ncbi:hypothetical protein Sste5346_009909 [Sporothrix stenoceras]|uniref:rRNA adenine N(6)-methyltransferase n=1 Tax=Sporothrix stenoceras TaxID=5173 RepID=A0ABR3YHV2_9PEZI
MLAARAAPRRLLGAVPRLATPTVTRPQWHRLPPSPPLFVCRQCRFETTTTEAAATAEKPKVKRKRRTKAEMAAAAEAEAAAAVDTEKPKVKRTRKKKVTEDAEATDDEPSTRPKRGRKTNAEKEAEAREARRKKDADEAPTISMKYSTNANAPPRHALQKSSRIAEELHATGLWNYGRWSRTDLTAATDAIDTEARPKKRKVKGDRNRVNIVSESLCDDTLKYIEKSLLPRHKGCDILDIYPGVGLWSRKLHDLLQPRSHILLEPDEDLYQPWLQPLLDRPNVKVIPKSGIIWRELSNILTPEHLPHQVERPLQETPQRNDTLLVTANLAFFPKRKFGQFASLSQLVLYQFINSIRASSLFNKYGLVRMLVWVESSDRHGLLARSIQRRRRMAMDGEMATEWITEIAGPDDFSPWFIRDSKLDMASTHRTLARMEKAGISIPAGRAPMNVHEATKTSRPGPKHKKPPPERLDEPPEFERPYREELYDLECRYEDGEFEEKSANHRRMLQLQYRSNREAKVAETINDLLLRREKFADEHDIHATRAANIRLREQKWTDEFDALSDNDRQEYSLYKDNLHIFKQDPPVLTWDRRAVEPLVAKRDEFYPNAPCALLDIQPKAVHPLLRPTRARELQTTAKPASDGSGSTESTSTTEDIPSPWTPDYAHSADFFDLIIRGMLNQSADPVRKSIEAVWPGAAEGVLKYCPSLYDRRSGGHPVGGPYSELTARSLNEKQWIEILDAWMRWPFRPTLSQLARRISEEPETEDNEGMD